MAVEKPIFVTMEPLTVNLQSEGRGKFLHVGIGYLAGPSYRAVEHTLGRASLAVLAVIVLIAFLLYLRRRRRAPADR